MTRNTHASTQTEQKRDTNMNPLLCTLYTLKEWASPVAPFYFVTSYALLRLKLLFFLSGRSSWVWCGSASVAALTLGGSPSQLARFICRPCLYLNLWQWSFLTGEWNSPANLVCGPCPQLPAQVKQRRPATPRDLAPPLPGFANTLCEIM